MMPSLAVSAIKFDVTAVAISMAWLVTVAAPMSTLSYPTIPFAPLPSPYVMLKVSPGADLKLLDLVGSYRV